MAPARGLCGGLRPAKKRSAPRGVGEPEEAADDTMMNIGKRTPLRGVLDSESHAYDRYRAVRRDRAITAVGVITASAAVLPRAAMQAVIATGSALPAVISACRQRRTHPEQC